MKNVGDANALLVNEFENIDLFRALVDDADASNEDLFDDDGVSSPLVADLVRRSNIDESRLIDVPVSDDKPAKCTTSEKKHVLLCL